MRTRRSGSALVLLVTMVGGFVVLSALMVALWTGRQTAAHRALLRDLETENALLSGLAIGEAALRTGVGEMSEWITAYDGPFPWHRDCTACVRVGGFGLLYAVCARVICDGHVSEKCRVLGSALSEPLDAALTIGGDLVIGSGGMVDGDIRSPERPEIRRGAWHGEWIPMPEGSPHRASARVRIALQTFANLLVDPPETAIKRYGITRIDDPTREELGGHDAVLCLGPLLIGSGGDAHPWTPALPNLLMCTDDVQISGAVVIRPGAVFVCAGEMRVLDNARIGQCLIYAEGGCRITDRSRIGGQVISPAAIHITGDAMVGPGAVVASTGQVRIDDNVWIHGSVMSVDGPCQARTNVRVDGAVWCGGSLALEGTVRGSVVAGRIEGDMRGRVKHVESGILVSPFLVMRPSGLLSPALVSDDPLPRALLPEGSALDAVRHADHSRRH